MVKFKGRLSFRQYLPSKPVKWGVKLWTLAESATGYLHQFQIYTGKEDGVVQEKGLCHRVVTELLTHFHHQNIRVFMDNYYTSTQLFTELIMRGIYACGTVRTNRKGLPPGLLPKSQKLQKHQYKVAQKDDLTFVIWMDTKAVLALSNYHDPLHTGYVSSRSGAPIQQQVLVPQVIESYQQNMKGVDLCDQMLGYYTLNHRSRKWWRRIFHHLCMAAAFNGFVIAKDSNPEIAAKEWPNFQDFVEDLAEGLIGDTSAKREAPVPEHVRPAIRHDMKKIFATKKNCKECRLKANPGDRVPQTLQGCEQCQIPVCNKCISDHLQRCNNV